MTAPSADNAPTLELRDGRLRAHLPGVDDPVAVEVVLLRPLTARTEIALINDDGEEVALLSGLDDLTPSSRELAEAALQERYFMPVIRRVLRAATTFGTHYWHVVTDKGEREFALKEPGKNITWLSDDRLVLRDTLGNRFEIVSLAGLDEASRKQAQMIV